MNIDLINKYNSIVQDDDEVYILGDLCLGGSDCREANFNLLKQLKGKIHIILGNHCTNARQEMYKELPQVVSISYAEVIKYRKYNFYLSHYPTMCSNHDDDKPLKAHTINLCGHSHTKDPFFHWDNNYIYHCEVDAHDGYPISLDYIIDDIKNRFQEDIRRTIMQINAIKKLFDQTDLTSTDCEPQLISFKDHPIANCDKCIEIPGFTCPGVERPFMKDALMVINIKEMADSRERPEFQNTHTLPNF